MSRQPEPASKQNAQAEDDPYLFLVAEPFTMRSYSVGFASLILIAALLTVLVWIVIRAEAIQDHAQFIIMAMSLALLLGLAVASLFSPLNATEESRFGRILGTLGGVVSGFTLAKVSDLASWLNGKFPAAADHWIETGFFVMPPLSCLLAGMISATILRSMVSSYWENRKQIERRRLHEKTFVRRD